MFLCSSCIFESENLLGKDIRLFKKTPVWSLAKAVEKENLEQIRYLVKEKNVPIDFQETCFGNTVLLWATYHGKVKSIEVLLKLGANPNTQDYYNGDNAIMIASGASFYDETNRCNSTLLRLMLKHGGDVNSVQQSGELAEKGSAATPLTKASSVCLEKVKLLVEAGADINYVDSSGGGNPLGISLVQEKSDIARYLLIEKRADYHNAEKVIFIDGKDTMRVVYLLRHWLFPLDSEEYKIKMEIVDYMLQQGEDYWAEPIPQDYLKKYPKEYLEKY
ncbi:hypothetical protein FACS1894123_06400 [Bacteroidia bacterium]|nr:hypothetical protein FACS1894123_06400 [Bacteroidia bacterium]